MPVGFKSAGRRRIVRLSKFDLTWQEFLIVGWAAPAKLRCFHLSKVGRAHPTPEIGKKSAPGCYWRGSNGTSL